MDFTGSDDLQGSINSPYANTASAAFYSLQFFLAPARAVERWHVHADPPGDPGEHLAESRLAGTDHRMHRTGLVQITSAIWQALAKASPERVTGSTCSECNWFVSTAVDRAAGRAEVFSDLPAGGWGGTPFNDGMNVTMDPLGNCMNMAAETAELFFPIEYESFDLRQDSAGAGKFRGGLGANFKIRYLCEGELNMETSRTRKGSPGVNGGGHSAVQRSTHLYPDGSRKVIGGLSPNGDWTSPLLSGHAFNNEEQFLFESTGGGGWGPATERPVAKVLDDVLDEYVSIDAAREHYGVVIDPQTMTVNEAETARLRAIMK